MTGDVGTQYKDCHKAVLFKRKRPFEVVMASPGLQRRSMSKPRTSSSSSSSNTSRAFYEPPPDKQTAAQIVRESREWLHAVSTHRPYTPKDQPRSLFGTSYKPVGSKQFQNAKQSVAYPTSNKPFNVLDTGCPVQVQTYGRGRYTRKLTPGEEYTLSASSAALLKIRDEPNMSAPGSHRASEDFGKTKLELVGKQTKLITPNQPKLLAPALSQMGMQFVPSPVPVKETTFTQRAKVVMAEAKKRGPRSGEPSVRRSPIVSLPNTAPSSATRPYTKSPYNSPASSDLDSGINLRASYTSQLSPSEERSITDRISPSEGSELPLLKPGTSDPISKSLPGGLKSHRAQSIHKTSSPTSASGDSGLSSGSELDHLITRLTELPRHVNYSGSPEPELSVNTPNRTPQSIGSPPSESYEATIPEEQEAIKLVNRIHAAIAESGLSGKVKWPSRSLLLQTAFALLDWPSSRFRLALIRLILTVQVTGQNLITVCKLLYRISKQAANDALFLEHPDTIECLLRTLQHLDTALPMSGDGPDLSSDPMLENLDAMVFFTGTLKFLAASSVVADALHNHPAFLIGLLSLHQQVDKRIRLWNVKTLTKQATEDGLEDLEEQLYSVLVQISDIFCHLTGNPGLRARLIFSGGIMDHVVDCLIHQVTPSNQKTSYSRSSAQYLAQFNWIRFLARLTEYTEVCLRLDCWSGDELNYSVASMNTSCAGLVHTASNSLKSESRESSRMAALCTLLFSMIQAYSDDMELTVRIAYLLGNLTARLDSAREVLFPNPLALTDMCGLCRDYRRMTTEMDKGNRVLVPPTQDDPASAWLDAPNQSNVARNPPLPQHQPCLEVVNKLVRILANSAIGEAVGQLAVMSTECLDLFLDVIAGECPREPTELLVNCLAGLNNITYYVRPESSSAVLAKQYDVAELLIRTLGSGAAHPDVMLGVIRVFGNLTRQPNLRNWINQQAGQLLLNASQTAGVIEPPTPWPSTVPHHQAMLYILIQNLDSARPELVYSTLGVLINLMTDVDQRPAFKELGGIPKLVEVLKDFAGHDWQLAGLACKALWNYTEGSKNSIRHLIDTETLNELYSLLIEFIDQNEVDRMHQNFLEEDPNVEQESLTLWKAAWSSEFFPVASEFLARLNYG
ncbi:hypothetical protein D915_002467 [Fasciola hepatica]|uniref:Armadillo repeat-containing protein 2 n=1 Tax=Fasciola hepatica TaxID=6192 RepID=A0A4E0S1J8_FASHE|nr:hypothetical protein D915_002467 [Fasciola hepatica]